MFKIFIRRDGISTLLAFSLIILKSLDDSGGLSISFNLFKSFIRIDGSWNFRSRYTLLTIRTVRTQRVWICSKTFELLQWTEVQTLASSEIASKVKKLFKDLSTVNAALRSHLFVIAFLTSLKDYHLLPYKATKVKNMVSYLLYCYLIFW